MRLPKMIVFDYGDTILCEPGFDLLREHEVLLNLAVRNPRGITPEAANELGDRVYEKYIVPIRRQNGIEHSATAFLRLLYEYLQIEFDVSWDELELIAHDAISTGAKMPNADQMLEYVHNKGIRTAVLSNNSFSGRALTARINRLLPGNHFEFIISTADYLVRKPDKMIFEIALRKANLEPQDVWFCGDNVVNDVLGASSVGMFPVWYEDNANTAQLPDWKLLREREENLVPPECGHLHIHDWLELIEVLKTL